MGIHNYKLEQPKDWQEFERLCHQLWAEILNDPNTLMHGRQGQEQAGIDVYGNQFGDGKLYGIQCKGKDAHYGKQVSEKELRAEVKKALTFSPNHPSVFILATTAPRDQKIQRIARDITNELRSGSKMKVLVFGWEDICERIVLHSNVINLFYPHHSSVSQQLVYSMGEIKDAVVEIKNSLAADHEVVKKMFNSTQVKKYFSDGSNGLLSWPRTLHSNNNWIERQEEQEITLTFDTHLHSSSIVLGEPGSGKSALLSKIAQNLVDEGEMVLAIKADQLDHSVIDFKTLGLALGLPGAVDQCIEIASKYGSVYLVIDQLDTLSELVDVKTNRLSVLLSLIRQISVEPNVHILASSRPFEFNYDVRLSSIKATQIQLHALKWEVAEKILINSGIYIRDAHDVFKNFLCRVSNLNFYLSYLKDNPQKHFQSHIELYEDIWNSSLGVGDDKLRRSKFLLDIASIMTNDAKQALPIIRYEEHARDIDWLIEVGILVKNAGKKNFSFAHQTLQAFVWTRAFIKQNASLKDFIVTHQNNLNVRPRLSTTLFYMREADPDEYNAQLTSILSTHISIIRRHVVHLLIECIGAHHDPSQNEINLLKVLSNDNYYQARVCKAVSGKSLWFENLKDDVLPKLMQSDSSSKFFATYILSSVLPEKIDAVFLLIEKYWRKDDSVDYIFYVLRSATAWNTEMLEQAKLLLSYPSLGSNITGVLYRHVLEKSREMALELSAHYFSNKLKPLKEKPVSDSATTPVGEADQAMADNKHDPEAKPETLFDFGSAWHNLSEVAQDAPDLFIHKFWMFFLHACEQAKCSRDWESNAYEYCSRLLFRLSDDNKDIRNAYFTDSLEKAIVLYARNFTDDFLSLYDSSKKSQLLPVQRILMKGLCEVANQMPDFVLTELTSDRRRLKLGSSTGDHYSGTKEIITVLSKLLTKAKLHELEMYITSFNQKPLTDDRSVESRQYDLAYNRRVRYQLLSAIDVTNRSVAINKIMAEEERALGSEIKKNITGGFSSFIAQVSPMNEEQLAKAKDDDIIKCFQAFPDHHDNWHGSGRTYAGATELGRTFEKFAKNNPARAISIIKKLSSKNILSVGHGLVGLSNSDISLLELLDLIDHTENIFAGSDFYEDASRAIINKLSRESPLNQEWLKKIEKWLLTNIPISTSDELSEEDRDEKDKKNESVLWGHGGHYSISSRNYHMLECLTIGHFLRDQPLAKEWSDIIIKYVHQGDSIGVWLTFLATRFPKIISYCEADQIERIMDAILESYPRVISHFEIAYSLAESIKHVSNEKYFAWMEVLFAENTSRSLQLYGELLGIKWIIDSHAVETNSRITALIDTNNIPVLCGLCYTLKEIWQHRKELISDLYVRLINLRDKRLSTILLGLLSDSNLTHSDELNKILDTFIANDTLALVDEPDSFIAHCILPLTVAEPVRVSKICEGILSAHGKSLGDLSTAASVGTSDLITIAITLHNLGPTFQKIGLDIFEKLMDIDAYQVQETLDKIDLVPKVNVLK